MLKRRLSSIHFSTIGLLLTIPMMAVLSVPAQAQIHWTVLIIHGRTDPNNLPCGRKQSYGVFDTDKDCVWNVASPATYGHVKYVYWDAWNHSFDDPKWPGGEAVVHAAVFDNCDVNKAKYCSVICHSAGCAAFEHFVAVSAHDNVVNAIVNVIAAGSAAGGSELANLESKIPAAIKSIFQAVFGEGKFAALDHYITTSYARNAYDHNNMHAIPIRAIGGTGGKNGIEGDLQIFPYQGDNSGTNPDCQQVFFDTHSMCSDTAVALHSSCGHNRVASFQDCNSRLYPYRDSAGTYDFHGWWISDRDDNVYNGPFSSMGKESYNSRFHTYNHSHTELKKLATEEYSACHSVVGFNQFYCW